MSNATHRQKPAAGEIARHVPKGLELGLRNYWYPVMQGVDLPAHKPVGFKALNESLVAWRDKAGRPRVLRDKCPHSWVMSLPKPLNGIIKAN